MGSPTDADSSTSTAEGNGQIMERNSSVEGPHIEEQPLPLLQELPLPKWVLETYLETLRLILRDVNVQTGTIIIDYLWMSLSC